MAKAVSFREFTPQNTSNDLMRKLDQAPAEHAEALLAAFDLLDRLHEKGIIDLLAGLLCAGDTVVERAADVVSSREAVTALRLTLIFGSLLVSIDPGELQEVINGSKRNEPPSFISIAKAATSRDTRRGMATAVGLLKVFGVALSPTTRV